MLPFFGNLASATPPRSLAFGTKHARAAAVGFAVMTRTPVSHNSLPCPCPDRPSNPQGAPGPGEVTGMVWAAADSYCGMSNQKPPTAFGKVKTGVCVNLAQSAMPAEAIRPKEGLCVRVLLRCQHWM
jgi:hypothetical protein